MNDSDENVHRLLEPQKKLPGMVNLIMFKPLPNAHFERPDEKRVHAFRNILLNHGHTAVVRNSRGREISAACGRLEVTVIMAADLRRQGMRKVLKKVITTR